MKKVLLGVVVVAAAATARAASAQTPPVASVTIAEAVDLAQKTLPQTVQAAGNLRVAAAGEKSALGSYLPNLSLSAGSSLAPQNRVASVTQSGINDSYNARLSMSYDLFTGGRRGAEKNQAEAQTASAEAGLLEQRYNVALTTRQAFFNELRAGDQIVAAESRIKRAQEALDAATQRQKLGSATQSDVLRAKIELSSASEALLTAQTQQTSARFALGRLVGADGPVAAKVDAPVEVTPLSLTPEQIVALAVSQAPAIRAAEATTKAADASVDAARAQYLPSLSLSAGYGWQNQDIAFSSQDLNWSLGVGLSYPLFNGFAREEAMERAQVQENVARAQLADAQRLARANAESAVRTLSLAEQRIRMNEEVVAAAQEDLRVQRERYRVGASTILDLLTSQESLVKAENGQINARYDYQVARAELESLLGRSL